MADEATYIYVLKLTRPDMVHKGPTPEELKTTHDHFNYLRELTNKGSVDMKSQIGLRSGLTA